MSIDTLCLGEVRDLRGLEINTSGAYALYCIHDPDEAMCIRCMTEDRERYEKILGASYGLPSSWDPPSTFGIGGPGEARTIFPGLVERERVDFSGHSGLGVHNNVDYFSTLTPNPNEPIMPDRTIHLKLWEKF